MLSARRVDRDSLVQDRGPIVLDPSIAVQDCSAAKDRGGAKVCSRAKDRGAVTAEFAIVLPAVLVVLALAVGAILIATQRVVLTSAAAEVARLEARGDANEAAARLGALPPRVTVTRSRRDGLLCVSLSSHPLAGLLAAVGVSARGCAVLTEALGLFEHSTLAVARGQPNYLITATLQGRA